MCPGVDLRHGLGPSHREGRLVIGPFNIFLALIFASIVGGASGFTFQLAKLPAAERPTLGARGLNRAKALSQGTLFPWVEPTLRLLAAWLAPLRMERIRAQASAVR